MKEPTFESLTKKKKEYMPPKFMSVAEASSQLLEIITKAKSTGDKSENSALKHRLIIRWENSFNYLFCFQI